MSLGSWQFWLCWYGVLVVVLGLVAFVNWLSWRR